MRLAVIVRGAVLAALPVASAFAQSNSPPQFLLAWGSRGDGDSQFYDPGGMATDAAGNVFVTDNNGPQPFRLKHGVKKFRGDGTFVWWKGWYGPHNGDFYYPGAVAADEAGYVYVANTPWVVGPVLGNKVTKLTNDGSFVASWALPWRNEYRSAFEVVGIAVDRPGNIYTATSDDRVVKFSSDLRVLAVWGGLDPIDIAIGGDGTLYVPESSRRRVRKFSGDGADLGSWDVQATPSDVARPRPRALTVAANGTVYLVDAANDRIHAYTTDGVLLHHWGGHGAAEGQFDQPSDVATDAAGHVYVFDRGNYRIQQFGYRVAVQPTTWSTVKSLYR